MTGERPPSCSQSGPLCPRRSGTPSSCEDTGACRGDAARRAGPPLVFLLLVPALALPAQDSVLLESRLAYLLSLSVCRGTLLTAGGGRGSFRTPRGALFAALA